MSYLLNKVSMKNSNLAVIFFVLSLSFLSGNAAIADDSMIGPQALVKSTTVKMFSKLKTEKQNLDKNPDLIYGMVSKIVLPHFDFITMSKWVLGKNWKKSSKAQKIGFIKAFRKLMVRTYSVALLEYTDSEFKYKPLRDDVTKGDVTVRTQTVTAKGDTVSINYSLHKKKKGWKVYDISVEGVSLIATYKTSFGSEIKQKGIDALIARLQGHNKKQEG